MIIISRAMHFNQLLLSSLGVIQLDYVSDYCCFLYAEHPTDLKLNLPFSEVIEGQELSVAGVCESSGADPPSQYRYGE